MRERKYHPDLLIPPPQAVTRAAAALVGWIDLDLRIFLLDTRYRPASRARVMLLGGLKYVCLWESPGWLALHAGGMHPNRVNAMLRTYNWLPDPWKERWEKALHELTIQTEFDAVDDAAEWYVDHFFDYSMVRWIAPTAPARISNLAMLTLANIYVTWRYRPRLGLQAIHELFEHKLVKRGWDRRRKRRHTWLVTTKRGEATLKANRGRLQTILETRGVTNA